VGAAKRGYLAGISAYFMWGLFPPYFKLLAPSGALEILAHRVLWSGVFAALLLLVLRRGRQLRAVIAHGSNLPWIALAATLIGTNWGTYTYAVTNNHIVDSSLGYFVCPLFVVLLGVLALGERLGPIQWTGLAIGATAFVVLTVDYGQPPWIALSLAAQFSAYGLVKKRLNLPALESLFLESVALALPALAYLIFLENTGKSTFLSISGHHAALLVGAGVITAIPLMCFADAATRIPLSSLGPLQYISPIMLFVFGVVLYDEPMSHTRLAGFALIWMALLTFAYGGLRRQFRSHADKRAGPTQTAGVSADPTKTPETAMPVAG
jgi:chloramphenicol-sensitive protein RarD